jgi:eukaryotic-like serine/threonine-protein kinase
MDAKRRRQIESLYHSARELKPHDRDALLAEACTDDAELRREVESLLRHDADDDKFPTAAALQIAAQTPAQDAGHSLIGQEIGTYKILSLLGVGGMGQVYRAKDLKLRRDVAIKVLPSRVANDPDRLRRFEREARFLATLNHPNIAAIYGFEQKAERPALVLELVEGATLAERLVAGPLPLDEAFALSLQIADALEGAHEKGIIHRDLKPANIKITPEGRVKVLDFGLAKAFSGDAAGPDLSQLPTMTVDGTQEGIIAGTPSYMSPEQARGKAVDKRTDIWAFGCVLFEMLTGRTPFLGETISDVIAAVIEREPDWTLLPSATPSGVVRLIRRMLAKDPKRRIRDIGDVKIDLEERHETPLALTAIAPPTHTRRYLWAAVLALGAITGTGLLLYMTARREVAALPNARMEQLTFDPGFTAMPALSPDGRMLAYASDRAGRGDLDIWVQQTAGGAPLRLTDDPTDDQTPAFSPDGSQIVFRSERDGGGLYLISSFGGNARRIAADGRSPRFSPDGKHLAYSIGNWRGQASDLRGRVYLQALAGGQPVRLLPDFFAAREPIWSPDGRSLIVLGRRDRTSPLSDSFDLWFAPIDGRPPVKTGALDLQHFRNAIDAFGISTSVLGTWMPSGLTVSFPEGLWLIPISPASGQVSGPPHQLTFGTSSHLQPAASSDGQVVFAATESPRVVERAPLNNDGAAVVLYTDGQTGPSRPSTSADGSKIVYERATTNSTEIWIKVLGGGPDRMVTSVAARGGLNATLSPDGTRIGYTLVGQSTDQTSGFVIEVKGGVPARLCEDCGLFGFLSDNRRVLALDSKSPRLRAIDVTSGESQDVLKTDRDRFGRTHLSPNDKWVAFQRAGKVMLAPIHPGEPAPEATWIAVDQPTTTGRPCGWSVDSQVLYMLLDTDGFRCLWGQRISPATGHPVGKPYAVRHFHYTPVQEFSTSFGNAITSDGFLYGGVVVKANLWRLIPATKK